jgi:hypothetical protein
MLYLRRSAIADLFDPLIVIRYRVIEAAHIWSTATQVAP